MGERGKNKALLLGRGWTEEQVENFLAPGNPVVYVTLHLPPAATLSTLEALGQLSIVTDPVKVRFCLSKNRYDEFIKIAEEASGQKVMDGSRKPGDLTN